MKNTYIYLILNPTTNEVRYIGKTVDPKRRFYEHLNRRVNNHCSNWIYSLLQNNILPEFVIIDEVFEQDWQFYEKYWISQFKSWGFNLTNMTNGGEGCLKREFSEETKIKISIGNKGKHKYWLGKKFSRQHIINMSKKRKPFPKEQSTKLSTINKGRILSEDTKLKISQSLKGKNNPSSKKVINTETKVIYDTVKDACLDNNIKYTTLFAQLTGKNKNKTKLEFYVRD